MSRAKTVISVGARISHLSDRFTPTDVLPNHAFPWRRYVRAEPGSSEGTCRRDATSGHVRYGSKPEMTIGVCHDRSTPTADFDLEMSDRDFDRQATLGRLLSALRGTNESMNFR